MDLSIERLLSSDDYTLQILSKINYLSIYRLSKEVIQQGYIGYIRKYII